MSRSVAYGASLTVLAFLLSVPADAAAQSAPANVQEVVVTGSLIRGGVQIDAQPVDVLTAEDISKQGSPSLVDLLKALPASSGVLGESNGFDGRSTGSEGTGSVNLRGLGPQRTLVLLNGRRMPINPNIQGGTGVVDTNLIPVAAIGRIEVLKDGAASTYGSDAIAGVVNFITRRGFEGLELNADYTAIEGSSGNYGASAIWGMKRDSLDVLFTAAWQHRSVLSVRDRDWALQDYETNPEGNWNPITNPSIFLPFNANGTPSPPPRRDVACELLGGYAGFANATTPACFARAAPFDNLIEKEDHYQVYGELNYDFGDNTRLHVEGHWALTEVPEYATAPSFPVLTGPTAEAVAAPSQVGSYNVPANHPGLLAYYAANNLGPPPAGGVRLLLNRPFGLGGNPAYDYGGATQSRRYEQFRVSAGLSGEAFGDALGWNLSATYGETDGSNTTSDTLPNRLQLALRGLGGERCNRAANTPGQNGCLYYNPFSNAIPGNPITGAPNPGFVPALENSAEVAEYFFKEDRGDFLSTALVLDAVLDGTFEGFRLGGGEVRWALGGQYRRNGYKTEFGDLRNILVNPCSNTLDFGVTNCPAASRTGAFSFTPAGTPQDLSTSIYAAFAELRLPLLENLEAQLGARYERYEGSGSTFDPKISARWAVNDWLAVRGSASSTFRAPALTQQNDLVARSLGSILGSFRAIDIQGDPNLDPETANSYSIGLILTPGRLRATIDYWRYDFSDPIATEPVNDIVNTVFPNGAAGANNCNNPALAALVARFTFSGPCGAATLTRLLVRNANGADQNLSGVDFGAEYDFGDVFGGGLSAGLSISYVDKFEVSATEVEGVTVSSGFDGAGKLNFQTNIFPIPRWKGVGFIERQGDGYSVRLSLNYVGEMTDQRISPFAPGTYRDRNNQLITVTRGKVVKGQFTTDLAYRQELPYDARVTISVRNLFDKDPPFARLSLNYEPFAANPAGRQVKVAISKTF